MKLNTIHAPFRKKGLVAKFKSLRFGGDFLEIWMVFIEMNSQKAIYERKSIQMTEKIPED